MTILAIFIFILGLSILIWGEKDLKPLKFIGIVMVSIAFTIVKYYSNDVKIDLPEEYPLIEANDTLKGHYTPDGVLHIEFNNKRN